MNTWGYTGVLAK